MLFLIPYINIICQEYQNEINDLKNNYESMKVSKDNLELEMQRLKMNLDSDLAVVHDAQTTQSGLFSSFNDS